LNPQATNRVGVEELGDNNFYGSSYFVSPRGQMIGEAGSDSEDEVILRDLDMSVLKDVRQT
jgi:beta-ureidopropionase